MATEVATLLFAADTRPLKSANDELAKTERAGVRAENAAKKMGTELKKAANDSINPLQKVSTGVSALSSALVALGSALIVRQFISLTDQFTDLNSRLINATGSADAAEQAFAAISQTATTTFSSLQQTAEAFLLNSMALNELGFTTRQQVGLADALNNALVISGTKGERAASVMNALSKAMALGKLSGENFNTVIQSGGRVVQALADGIGVTTQELRAMATEGLLTTELIISAMTSQMEILRSEAEEMPATIGDALVQFSNLTLEVVGRMDEAVGLSSSIAGFMISAIENFRRIHLPDETQRLMNLQMRSIDLTIQLANANKGLMASAGARMTREKEAVDAEINALLELGKARIDAETAAAAAGIVVREQLEAKRIADHQAELERIEAEKVARRESQEEESRLRDIARQQERKGSGSKIESLAEIERKQNEDKFKEMVRQNRLEADLDEQTSRNKIENARQQTEQLLALEDVLLQGKSSALSEAFRIGVNFADQEKRATAAKIIMKSYEAAMSAYASLAGIPIIGPALGAAAAASIIAAGASFSAKSLSGRALGGQVRGGESYIVGERGPEVLTMGSSNGRIIPNSSMANPQSTGTVNNTANVTFSIVANDTRGFDDLLLKRRGMIASLVQSSLNNLGRSI